MARVVAMLLILFSSGCTALPDWAWLSAMGGKNNIETGHYNFAWRLSGDRAVAPLQVFDNGRQMWLQFAAGQAVPAIFTHTPQGDRPLDYHRNGPYLVLQGVWPSLVLRGGHLKSFVERIEPAASDPHTPASPGHSGAPASSEPAPVRAPGPLGSAGDTAQAGVAAAPAPRPGLAYDASAVSFAEQDSAATIAAPAAVAPAAVRPGVAAPAVPDDPAVPVAGNNEPAGLYQVGPQDMNLRAVLSRWANFAGWTFEPEHWAVDADIPIAGSARFDSGFKDAVQELVASTELADRPLQPCFYSNKVLRIVPYAQLCDRTANLSESS